MRCYSLFLVSLLLASPVSAGDLTPEQMQGTLAALEKMSDRIEREEQADREERQVKALEAINEELRKQRETIYLDPEMQRKYQGVNHYDDNRVHVQGPYTR